MLYIKKIFKSKIEHSITRLWPQLRVSSAYVVFFSFQHNHAALNDLFDTLLITVVSCCLVWYITCQASFLLTSWEHFEVIEDGGSLAAEKKRPIFWRNYSFCYFYWGFLSILFDIHVRHIFLIKRCNVEDMEDGGH